MASITTRAGKGSPLTNAEVDANFDNLNTGKLELSGGTLTGALTLHADPTQALHAASKQYVDEVAEGLRSKPAVRAATTTNLAAVYDNGTAGVGATLTADTNRVFTTLDGVTSWAITTPPMGVLVKNQTNSAHNGRYNLTSLGEVGVSPWVLTRCGLCDEADEIPGAYTFVQFGTANGGTGWVQTVVDPDTFVVGTDAIIVAQFSGAGTYTAGTGLTLTGNQFAMAADQLLPTQTGNSGKYLSTNGTATSWAVLTPPNNGTLTLTVAGTGLSGGTTFTADQSSNATFTVTSNATSANTVGAIVARDGSGNFTAGTITAALSGNATTATTLATARTIGGVSFNGSANIDLPGVNTAGNQNTTGNAATATNVAYSGLTGTVPTWNQNTTGSAATLTTGRTIAITGDLTYTSPTFNGSTNVTAAGTLATVNSNVGSFTNASVTVNGKGLVTAVSSGTAPVTAVSGTSPVVSSGGATPAISLSAGYGDTLNPYASKTANTFLAAPDASAGVPTFRAVVAADIPTLNQSTTGNAATATTATNLSGGTVAATTITATTSIMPAADNTGVVGDASFTWSNGHFTSLTVDSTLNVRAAIDLADNDILRFGSSDDWEFFHNGTDNYMDLNVGNLIVRDNTTTRFTFGRTTGDLTATTFTGALVGNATTATTLQTARTIGGVSFDGSANINLPGVNTAGNQNTTGTAANVTGTVAVANGGTGQTTYTNGQLLIGNTTGNTLAKATLTAGTGITVTNGAGAITIAATNNGTVTSVGGTGTVSGLSLSGTVTTSGNLTLGGTLAVTPSNFASQTANTILAAPNGTAGVPTFRALVAADVPTLNQSTTGSAATVTTTVASGAVGTTQAAKTSGTSLATTAFADRFRSLHASATTGTAVIGDRGSLIRLAAGFTIPANVFATGDTFTLYNNTAGNLTITQGASLTLRLVGSATTGNRTLAQRGLSTVVFISGTEAVISGGGLT